MPVKDDRKNSISDEGCFKILKTIQNYLRIPFKCSHILCGIVAYHIIRQTLVTGHIETVLCRTVNPLVIQLHRNINFAMNKWQKLVSVACIDLASATFRRTIVSRGVSSTNYGHTHQLAVFVSKRFLQTGPNSPVRAKFVLQGLINIES